MTIERLCSHVDLGQLCSFNTSNVLYLENIVVKRDEVSPKKAPTHLVVV
jgi:hypothetical protein